MANAEISRLWESAFPEKKRPRVHTSSDLNEDGFRPLADPLDFIADISKLTASQLYAQSANNAEALLEAQDEFLELEKIINHLKSKDPTAVALTKNPQTLPTHTQFDERNESVLYGYKYDANRPLASYGRWQDATEIERRDLRSYQDPFIQGGFVPNDRQFKGLMNRAKDKRNPDGWIPVEKNGQKLIPKMAARVNEKEEYLQLSGLLSMTKTSSSKPVTRSGTPDVVDDTASRGTPVNKRLRNTRFNGAKVPLTRDVSEAPSLPVSRASTPKRKRGDTPHLAYEPSASPVKKPRITITTTEVQLPPRRKHHNQYTKAKEKAALEAMAATKSNGGLGEDVKMLDVPDSANGGPLPTGGQPPKRPWSGLTAEEMRAYHWNNETLKQAVADDHTWLTTDLNLSNDWRDKILASSYPVRTHSMFKKWREWRLNGEDKRPRNRNKSAADTDARPVASTSEVTTTTATPSPLGQSQTTHGEPEYDHEDDTVQTASGTSHASHLLPSNSQTYTSGYETNDEAYDEGWTASSSSSASAAASSPASSQTINVSQTLPVASTARRTTRAARRSKN